MTGTYTVEVVNLGKRPVADVSPATTVHADEGDATAALHRRVGALVVDRGLHVVGVSRPDPSRVDGVRAAVQLTDPDAGGRVEVLLRQRSDAPEADPLDA